MRLLNYINHQFSNFIIYITINIHSFQRRRDDASVAAAPGRPPGVGRRQRLLQRQQRPRQRGRRGVRAPLRRGQGMPGLRQGLDQGAAGQIRVGKLYWTIVVWKEIIRVNTCLEFINPSHVVTLPSFWHKLIDFELKRREEK